MQVHLSRRPFFPPLYQTSVASSRIIEHLLTAQTVTFGSFTQPGIATSGFVSSALKSKLPICCGLTQRT